MPRHRQGAADATSGVVTNPIKLDSDLVERFRSALDELAPPGVRLGVAVSGGCDSLALLLLAQAARPREVEAATVDHRLRAGSAAEAAHVRGICHLLGVPHSTFAVEWMEMPATGMQEKARSARYDRLGRWAEDRNIAAVLTGHHREDQAETVLMRLARGAGVRGLAAMRPSAALPGHSSIGLLRPLLDWDQARLEAICEASGITPVRDPSNADLRFERVRIRRALADKGWLQPAALARSASCLAQADEAIAWASQIEWDNVVSRSGNGIVYRPMAPVEVRRRIIARIIAELATEGGLELRGAELDRIHDSLQEGASATLRGVQCCGGETWRFAVAPARSPRGRKGRR